MARGPPGHTRVEKTVTWERPREAPKKRRSRNTLPPPPLSYPQVQIWHKHRGCFILACISPQLPSRPPTSSSSTSSSAVTREAPRRLATLPAFSPLPASVPSPRPRGKGWGKKERNPGFQKLRPHPLRRVARSGRPRRTSGWNRGKADIGRRGGQSNGVGRGKGRSLVSIWGGGASMDAVESLSPYPGNLRSFSPLSCSLTSPGGVIAGAK